MGKLIEVSARTKKQKVDAPNTEREPAHELRERETNSRMEFLMKIYGPQIKQMSEKERSN